MPLSFSCYIVMYIYLKKEKICGRRSLQNNSIFCRSKHSLINLSNLLYIYFIMGKQSLKTVLNKKSVYKVRGTLWIECEGEGFLGPGRVELMQRIGNTGSINKAAAEMGMSYKKAWEMINELNAQAAKPLVITQTGGEKGGGSIITEEAKFLIEYYKKLRERFLNFLDKETKNLTSL